MSLRLSIIACPSLAPELDMLAAQCGTEVVFQHLETQLHQLSIDALHHALQAAIDRTTDCDAIAIAYGLCHRGVAGLIARDIPLAIPRAHDCIALLLGSHRRYREERESAPGTYFQSAGWLQAARDECQPEFTFGPNSNISFEALAARFGDDNARYLMQEFEGFTRHYRDLAYIATPVAAAAMWEAKARAIAAGQQWRYRRLEGDTGWLERLLRGGWNDEEFLVVQPGQQVALSADERLFEAAP
jgi:hypothetical protein